MKEVSVSRVSWHYRAMNRLLDDMPHDVCAYIRWFIFLSIFSVVCFIAMVGILYAVGDFLAWITWMLLNLTWIGPSLIASVVLAVLTGGSIGVAIIFWPEGKFDSVLKSEGVQLIAAAYESVHDKVCFKINYK